MKRASLPIRMRGSFRSMPLMMRSAASFGVVFAAFSNRSIDCARRALSVTPTPVRELRAIAVATPPGWTTGSLTELPAADLGLVNLLERAHQRHACIVDDDAERGMRRDRFARERCDIAGLADVDAMHADLACGSDFGGGRLQSGFVTIGEGEIAAAVRQFNRQRAADAARRSCDGGSTANRSHQSHRQVSPMEL